MVFKVKQKALTDYKLLTSDQRSLNESRTFNFNWPYDQFSLVELAQIEASVSLTDERRTPLTNENGDPVIVRNNPTVESEEVLFEEGSSRARASDAPPSVAVED